MQFRTRARTPSSHGICFYNPCPCRLSDCSALLTFAAHPYFKPFVTVEQSTTGVGNGVGVGEIQLNTCSPLNTYAMHGDMSDETATDCSQQGKVHANVPTLSDHSAAKPCFLLNLSRPLVRAGCPADTPLQDSLGGNCNTLLLACIWGESQHLEETMSTLRLASRMMRVQNETHAVSGSDFFARALVFVVVMGSTFGSPISAGSQ